MDIYLREGGYVMLSPSDFVTLMSQVKTPDLRWPWHRWGWRSWLCVAPARPWPSPRPCPPPAWPACTARPPCTSSGTPSAAHQPQEKTGQIKKYLTPWKEPGNFFRNSFSCSPTTRKTTGQIKKYLTPWKEPCNTNWSESEFLEITNGPLSKLPCLLAHSRHVAIKWAFYNCRLKLSIFQSQF